MTSCLVAVASSSRPNATPIAHLSGPLLSKAPQAARASFKQAPSRYFGRISQIDRRQKGRRFTAREFCL